MLIAAGEQGAGLPLPFPIFAVEPDTAPATLSEENAPVVKLASVSEGMKGDVWVAVLLLLGASVGLKFLRSDEKLEATLPALGSENRLHEAGEHA
jgi:hypothetical protein